MEVRSERTSSALASEEEGQEVGEDQKRLEKVKGCQRKTEDVREGQRRSSLEEVRETTRVPHIYIYSSWVKDTVSSNRSGKIREGQRRSEEVKGGQRRSGRPPGSPTSTSPAAGSGTLSPATGQGRSEKVRKGQGRSKEDRGGQRRAEKVRGGQRRSEKVRGQKRSEEVR